MQKSTHILVVEDNRLNREMLREILEDEYMILEAENGKEALEIVKQRPGDITAVLSDITMPVMGGFELLKEMKKDEALSRIPFIVMTASDESEEEINALREGAWDFVRKPYNPEVIKIRLESAIARSRMADAEDIQYRAKHDILTGVYNKEAFFNITKTMLRDNPHTKFMMVYATIERFQFITAFYGAREGERLIKFMADTLTSVCGRRELFTYGRIESDIFCFCMEYSDAIMELIVDSARPILSEFGADYDIEPNFGVYVIGDNNTPIETMYNNAALASEEGAGKYLNYYTFYTDELDQKLKSEQEVLNDMYKALENDEFVIYMQPKYNIYTNKVIGAEALVRWQHPKKGLMQPGAFIPIFEKNGFITKLDYRVWEKTCQTLRRWIDEGRNPNPVSVNISQVNIYNANLAQNIIQLADKYNLPHRLLELEITESAYGNNPEALIKLVEELRLNGFTILMDDFGNAYSSLNILKDIEVDVLKLDMMFLADTKETGRGENIIASVIRMAKWLQIDVIVEGVEEFKQAEFLKTVGCNYAQGYYYSKPIPISEYESIALEQKGIKKDRQSEEKTADLDVDYLFKSNPQMKVLFGDLPQALAILEFDGENIEFVRVNSKYFDVFGIDDPAITAGTLAESVDAEYRQCVLDNFNEAIKTKGTAQCDFLKQGPEGSNIWVSMKLRYLREIEDRQLLMGLFEDITAQKKIDFELSKYRQAVQDESKTANTMLIVDDVKANRAILKKIFKGQYTFAEAENGKQALDILKKEKDIALILLDIVMPEMNGWQFLETKNNDRHLSGIPVIVISGEDKVDEQANAADLGVSDYIVKPFVPEIVKKRVNNVMDSVKFMKETVKKYDSTAHIANVDTVTGMYSYDSARKIIEEYLEDFADDPNAMVVFGIEDYQTVSETYDRMYDESFDRKIGSVIGELFRREDVGFRSDAGMFCMFAKNFKDVKRLKSRLDSFAALVTSDNNGKEFEVVCSVGAAFSPAFGTTFDELMDNAKTARQEAKTMGQNKSCIYSKKR